MPYDPMGYKKWTVDDARIVMEDINKFGLKDEYSPEEIAHAKMLLKQVQPTPTPTPKPKKKGLGVLKSVQNRQKALQDVLME